MNLKTKDANDNNWVDRFAPMAVRPYLRLARADRPIGTWLLLWPCWWSIALAAPLGETPDLALLALFAVGAFSMRGAGCALNDIVDRNYDAQVARTRSRPIPSGQITVKAAFAAMALMSLLGLWVLAQLNPFAILIGLLSLPIVAIYPFMKRITHWPQFVLGLAFNWGALLGWAAVRGEISEPAILLYVGGIFWTLGYDTIYAHQDKEDDAIIGVKSTALRLGGATKPALFIFYTAAAVCFMAAGREAGMSAYFVAGAAAMTLHLAMQITRVRLDNSGSCLKTFKSNTWVGWLLFVGIIAGHF